MGNLLNQKRKITINSFLGQKPTKVIEKYTMLDDKSINTIMCVNDYLMSNPSTKDSDNEKLGIHSVGNLAITTRQPVIILGDETYLPIFTSFKIDLFQKEEGPAPKMFNYKTALYAPSGLVYIRGMVKRPEPKFIVKWLAKILSSEYPGSVQVPCHRYVYCFDNGSKPFLTTLLMRAVHGDGSVIDYSWIAPIQELLDQKDDMEVKRKKLLKVPKFSFGAAEEDHEEEFIPNDEDDPTYQMAKNYLNTTLKQPYGKKPVHWGLGVPPGLKKTKPLPKTPKVSFTKNPDGTITVKKNLPEEPPL